MPTTLTNTILQKTHCTEKLFLSDALIYDMKRHFSSIYIFQRGVDRGALSVGPTDTVHSWPVCYQAYRMTHYW